ncbi:prepilin peptidase [Pectinatus sottacetonis]|uniref:prepilin peptidase n=1 Tax=Pectinatus sottacetonis TaxID=1002795 RepID=UPI0018C64588|nr:prepilin peptidase [Pectinatus sottacetonis]
MQEVFNVSMEILLFTWLAVLLSTISSIWISRLYNRNIISLTFPERRIRKSVFRCYFLPFCYTLFFSRFLLFETLDLFLLQLTAAFFLLLIICTDIEQQVILNEVIILFSLFSLLSSFIHGPMIADSLMAAFTGGGIFLLLAVLTKGGIGGGDIKLIFSLGLLLGPDKLMIVIIIGFLLGGCSALVLILTRKKKSGEFFAYGPYFALPALLIYVSSF